MTNSIEQPRISNKKHEINIINSTNIGIKTIVHISDVHIPLNLYKDRKDEYITVFNRLYDSIRNNVLLDNTIIVISGDLIHTKGVIESDTILLVREFITQLSNICYTIIALGNHDIITEGNYKRIDMVSAVCNGISNIHILKYTGLYQISNILFCFSSLLDGEFIKYCDIPLKDIQISNTKIYKIYHGSVRGAINCVGMKIYNSSYPGVCDFTEYDAVLLGHIHKHQFFSNNGKNNIAYAGSLIQQNFSESIDYHGYLLWNVDTNTFKHIEIDNDYIFLNLYVDNGIVSNEENILSKYKNKKLRIKCKITNTTNTQFKILKSRVMSEYNVITINLYNNLKVNNIDDTKLNNPSHDDDVSFIREYCNKDMMDNIISLHTDLIKKGKSGTPQEIRYWNITKILFKNISVYGNDKENCIEFVHGINNICSPNKTGKTTIINMILYSLFDTIDDKRTECGNLISNGKTIGYIILFFECNGVEYKIYKQLDANDNRRRVVKIYKKQSPDYIDISGTSIVETKTIIKNIVGEFNEFISYNVISTKYSINVITQSDSERLSEFRKICKINVYDDNVSECENKIKELKLKINNNTIKLTTIHELRKNWYTDYEGGNMGLEELNDKLNGLNNERVKLNGDMENLKLTAYNINKRKELVNVDSSNTLDKDALIKHINELNALIEKSNVDVDSINKYNELTLTTLISSYENKIIHGIRDLDDIIKDKENLACDADSLACGVDEWHLDNQLIELESKRIYLTKLKDEIENISFNKDELNVRISELESRINELNDVSDDMSHYTPQLLNAMIREREQKIVHDIPGMVEIINEKNSIDITGYDDANNNIIIYNKKISWLNAKLIACGADSPLNESTLTQDELVEIESELIDLFNRYDKFNVWEKHDIFNSRYMNYSIDELEDEIEELIPVRPLLPIKNNSDKNIDINNVKSIIQDSPVIDGNIILPYDIGYTTYLSILNGDCNDSIAETINKEIYDTIETNKKIASHNELINIIITYKKIVDKWNIMYQWYTNEAIKCENKIRHKMRYDKLVEYERIQLNNDIYNTEIDKYKNILINIELKSELDTCRLNLTKINNMESVSCELNSINESIDHVKHERETRKKYALLLEEVDKWVSNNEINIEINKYKKILELILLVNKRNHYNAVLNSILDGNELTIVDLNIRELVNKINVCNKSIYNTEEYIKYASKWSNEYNSLLEENVQLEKTVSLYTEYIKLFGKDSTIRLLIKRLDKFIEIVNGIFTKYTKYKLCYKISSMKKINDKLIFTLMDANGNVCDLYRLSGFEGVILQVCINYAVCSINCQNTSGLFIVDEKFDCLDEYSYRNNLGDIVALLRECYNVIIFISHRNIDRELIDGTVKIGYYEIKGCINSWISN